jgi:hypothetical protein
MYLCMFRALNAHLQEDTLHTCIIWYCNSLREFVVACRCTVIPDHIPDEWPTCPHYILVLRPPQRNRAVSWMLAILVTSRTQLQRELTLQEYTYIDILKRSRWKLSTKVTQRRGVGTVLQMLDFSPWVETQHTSVKCYPPPPNRQRPIGGARTCPAFLGPTYTWKLWQLGNN